MSKIQVNKNQSGKKEYYKYFIVIPKNVIDKCALKAGDHLDFNGEFGGELRFTIRRAER